VTAGARNRLRVPLFDGSLFTWDGCQGATEASMLEPTCLGARHCSRVWDDACDEGFEVRSPRTGHIVLFVLSGELRDAAGEVVGWTYASCGEARTFTITVAND